MSIYHISYPGNPTIGGYPLFIHQEYSPLPSSVRFASQPITILFSHCKQNFDVTQIIEFVKFQYSEQKIELPDNYTILIKEG